MSWKTRATLGFLAGALLVPTAGAAEELYMVMPSSGHPWNNDARSNFDIADNSVQVDGASYRYWVTNFQVPSTATTVCASYMNGSSSFSQHRICSFNSNAYLGVGVYQCGSFTLFSNTGKNIAIPENGSAFLQSMMKGGGYVSSARIYFDRSGGCYQT